MSLHSELSQTLSKHLSLQTQPPSSANGTDEHKTHDTTIQTSDDTTSTVYDTVNDIESALQQVLKEFYPSYDFDVEIHPRPAGSDAAAPAAAEGRKPAATKKPIRAYVDGCFDLMHSGHYNAIRQAKALCDILVVGVHSDAEILRHKGPPVMNDDERMATVRACKWVDEIVFDTPYDPSLELLDKLNCDFCVHGDDMSTTADGKDAYAETKAAGRMRVVKRTEGISTTDLVGRLLLMTRDHHLQQTPNNSPPLTTRQLRARSGADMQIPSPSILKLRRQHTSGSEQQSPTAANSNNNQSNNLPTPTVHLPAHGQKSPQPKSPQPPAANKDYAAGRGISNFLPTTWRISQFSNSRVPTAEDVVVYIDGAFDLFHLGHIETLRRAKEAGTFLYVGVHDDATVNRVKGSNFPIMNLHERVLNVLSCKYVDEVIIGAPWKVTSDMIKTLNIQKVVAGSNTKFSDSQLQRQATSSLEDPYNEARKLGIYQEMDSTKFLNTTDVIQRIVDNRLKYENRNTKRSAKEVDYLTKKKEYVAEV